MSTIQHHVRFTQRLARWESRQGLNFSLKLRFFVFRQPLLSLLMWTNNKQYERLPGETVWKCAALFDDTLYELVCFEHALTFCLSLFSFLGPKFILVMLIFYSHFTHFHSPSLLSSEDRATSLQWGKQDKRQTLGLRERRSPHVHLSGRRNAGDAAKVLMQEAPAKKFTFLVEQVVMWTEYFYCLPRDRGDER